MSKASAHAFIQRRTLDSLMFGWTIAHKMNFPTTTVKRSLQMFADQFNLDAEEFDVDTAHVTFYRMLKEMQDYMKQKSRA